MGFFSLSAYNYLITVYGMKSKWTFSFGWLRNGKIFMLCSISIFWNHNCCVDSWQKMRNFNNLSQKALLLRLFCFISLSTCVLSHLLAWDCLEMNVSMNVSSHLSGFKDSCSVLWDHQKYVCAKNFLWTNTYQLYALVFFSISGA